MNDALPGWLEAAFVVSQAFAFPFCAMMVFAPRWSLSERVIPQRWWWLAIALTYVFFLLYAFTLGNAPSDVWLRVFWPTVVNEQANFSLWALVPTSGTHLTFTDTFVMRWIYLQERERPWSLQLVMGLGWVGAPLGLLAYTAYCALRESRRNSPHAPLSANMRGNAP